MNAESIAVFLSCGDRKSVAVCACTTTATMLSLSLVLFVLAIGIADAKDRKPAASEATHIFDLCSLNDNRACSGHGVCTSYLRNDNKPATRCACTYPYIGTTCQKKRFDKKDPVDSSSETDDKGKVKAVKAALREESSSSSESESEETVRHNNHRNRRNDADSERSDSESGFEDSDAFSEDSDDRSTWRHDDDRRHRGSSDWVAWVFGIIVILLICCCIGGAVWMACFRSPRTARVRT